MNLTDKFLSFKVNNWNFDTENVNFAKVLQYNLYFQIHINNIQIIHL